MGECLFAKYFKLPTDTVYSTLAGLADFMLHDYRIEVKTFAAETAKPNKRCTLLVTVDDAHDIPCDFYVLWSVNIDDVTKSFPVGWTTQHGILTAPVGIWSQKTGLLNHGVDRKNLRPLHELDAYIMRLSVIEQLADGRTMTVRWDTSHLFAAVTIDDDPQDYVYRGNRGGEHHWFSVFDPETPYPSYKDAVTAIATRASLGDGPGRRVAAT